jgi:hypothetical protein
MSALLAALLLASALLLALVLLQRLPRYHAYVASARLRIALGAGQVLLGLLWALWGALYLDAYGLGSAAGWYVIALGGLWTLQGARRLARRVRPR